VTTSADGTPEPDTRDEWKGPVGLAVASAICVIVFQLLTRPLLTQVVADVSKTASLEMVLQSKGVVAFGWVLYLFLPAIVSASIFRKVRTDLRDHRKVTWRRAFWFPTLWACLLASVFWVFAISTGFSFK
jgi:hypothetical protein